MTANNVHDALAQIKQLQGFILGKKNFSGYLWQTKIAGGAVVLLGTFIMASSCCPETVTAHLTAWVVIILIAMLINYGGLFYWFFYDKDSRRKWIRLLPAVDMLPEIVVGAVFTAIIIEYQQYDMLMGVWLCLYGLVHVSYRQALPKGSYIVGLFYIICGAYFLFQHVQFTNSLPAGIVIFAGETICGISLYKNRRQQNHE